MVKRSKFIEKIKAELIFAFQMADIRFISFYLGLKIEQNQMQKNIKPSQPEYIKKIFWNFSLNKTHFNNILMRKSISVPPKKNGKQVTKGEWKKY